MKKIDIKKIISTIKSDKLWWITIALAVLLSLLDGYLQLIYKGPFNIQAMVVMWLGIIIAVMTAYDVLSSKRKLSLTMIPSAALGIIVMIIWIMVFPW